MIATHKISRNEPCPCGSGRKYKRCCLPREEAARTAQLDAGRARLAGVAVLADEEWDARDEPLVDPYDQPYDQMDWLDSDARFALATARYWDDFFVEYYGATLDQQLAMIRRAIAEAPDLSHAYAAEIVPPLTHHLRTAGRIDDIEDLLARLDDRSPELAAASRGFSHYCRLMNALTRAGTHADDDFDVDIEAHLTALAHAAGEHHEYFLGAVHALMYHGRTSHIVAACRIAWPRVQAADNVAPSVRAAVRSSAIAVALDDFLANHDAWDETAFLAHIAPFHVPAMQPWWCDAVAQRNPATRRALSRADLLPYRITAASRRALELLLLQFADALHTRWAWPRSRAELAREALAELLAEQARDAQRERPAHGRHKGRKQVKRRRKARGHAPRHLHAAPLPWLANTAADVEDFALHVLIVPEQRVRQHHAAALVQAAPRWWQILAEHDVLTAPALHRLQQGTGELAALAIVFYEASADPALARDIAHTGEPGNTGEPGDIGDIGDTGTALPGAADCM